MQVDTLQYKAGDLIFRDGDEAQCMYLVKSGTVSIRKISQTHSIGIATIGQNQIFGEVAFFDRSPRSADAVAVGSVELIGIPYDKLDPYFQSAPDYLKKIIHSLAQRLRDADRTICELKEKHEMVSK
ncbi:MAG: cyclic nucleotide-binding domain-containing protein [Proteobacteria bacterium]|nr:MAG: cyclic nucleotide-binding domain-containing protein [Pseudomonadota bacterium]